MLMSYPHAAGASARLIIAHLQKAHEDLDRHLSPSEQAASRAFAALVQLHLEPASEYALWCDAEIAPQQHTWVCS